MSKDQVEFEEPQDQEAWLKMLRQFERTEPEKVAAETLTEVAQPLIKPPEGRRKSLEEVADEAWRQGDWRLALSAYRRLGDTFRLAEVRRMIAIESLEQEARRQEQRGFYEVAAGIYQKLLNEYPKLPQRSDWKFYQEQCWQNQVLPNFLQGQQAYDRGDWLEAKESLKVVVAHYPNFRKDGRMAGVLLQEACDMLSRDGVKALKAGDLQEALNRFRMADNTDKANMVDKIIRLRQNLRTKAETAERELNWPLATVAYQKLSKFPMSPNEQMEVELAIARSQEGDQLTSWFEEGLEAIEDEDWREAKMLFGNILKAQPKFYYQDQSAQALYNEASKRTLMKQMPGGKTAEKWINKLPQMIQQSPRRELWVINSVVWLPTLLGTILNGFSWLPLFLTTAVLMAWLLTTRHAGRYDEPRVGKGTGQTVMLVLFGLLVAQVYFVGIPFIETPLMQQISRMVGPMRELIFLIAYFTLALPLLVLVNYLLKLAYAVVGMTHAIVAFWVALVLAISNGWWLLPIISVGVIVGCTVWRERALKRWQAHFSNMLAASIVDKVRSDRLWV